MTGPKGPSVRVTIESIRPTKEMAIESIWTNKKKRNDKNINKT